ncbi:CPBP family intramembrane glutamic endopeptidase [Shouchella clausii]|uniref:CPBP family glutamic-type intramembrane protease n=1 Tax=Shouchella clausii TaxID=79880 RepID=UPI003245E96D
MNKKKLIVFICILFGISFGTGAVFLLSGAYKNPLIFQLFAMVYMLFPFISAVLTQKVVFKQPLAPALLLKGRFSFWWVLAAFLPFFLVSATVLVALVFPGTSLSLTMEAYYSAMDENTRNATEAAFEALPFHPLWMMAINAVLAGITLNALFAFGEEVAWRGLLLTELKSLGFWKASFLIGLLWGPWHAPLTLAGHNYPSTPLFGILMMTVFCMLLSPLLCFITIKAKTIYPAAFFHGVMNATAGIGLILVAGGNPELINGITGVAGFIVLGCINLVLYFCTRKTIDQSFAHGVSR